MKKILSAVLENKQPISKTLLLASFGAGYLVATILFTAFSHHIQHYLQNIFY